MSFELEEQFLTSMSFVRSLLAETLSAVGSVSRHSGKRNMRPLHEPGGAKISVATCWRISLWMSSSMGPSCFSSTPIFFITVLAVFVFSASLTSLSVSKLMRMTSFSVAVSDASIGLGRSMSTVIVPAKVSDKRLSFDRSSGEMN